MPGASMVDVTEKPVSLREAVARGRVLLKPETVKLIRERRVEKGDVESVASVAAILAVKRT
ncbi:MAG: cyclic pyranopterin monophosphate synthase MoaC, partial [Acidilobaceae archaeon]